MPGIAPLGSSSARPNWLLFPLPKTLKDDIYLFHVLERVAGSRFDGRRFLLSLNRSCQVYWTPSRTKLRHSSFKTSKPSQHFPPLAGSILVVTGPRSGRLVLSHVRPWRAVLPRRASYLRCGIFFRSTLGARLLLMELRLHIRRCPKLDHLDHCCSGTLHNRRCCKMSILVLYRIWAGRTYHRLLLGTLFVLIPWL